LTVPVTDEFDLDPTTEERIVSRAMDRGGRLHRRSTVLRRSVTVMVLLAVAVGAVTASHTQADRPAGNGSAAGLPSSTNSSAATTSAPASSEPPPSVPVSSVPPTTVPPTTVPPTTVPPTTVPPTTVPPTTVPPTTVPPTTVPPTTTTIPFENFSQSLSASAPAGQTTTADWTVPSSDRDQIATLTLTSDGSPAASGEVVLDTANPQSPSDLLDISLQQLTSGPVTINLQAPVMLAAGEQLELGLTCDQGSGASCGVGLSLTGQTDAAPFAPTALFSDEVGGSVAGETSGVVGDWPVPTGDLFYLSDFVLSAPGGEQGTVQVLVGDSPATATSIFSGTLAALSANLVHEVPSYLKMSSGEHLYLSLDCSTVAQSACSADLLFTGQLLPPLD
jgi:hypothetical protein